MLQIAICEDEKEQAIAEETLVHACVPELAPQVRIFLSADALLNAVQIMGYRPRVAILDIELGDADGISLAERLNTLLPDCSVIYLTAFLKYAPDVYSTRHTYYIMKQDAPDRLGKAIRKALEEQRLNDKICFRTTEGLRFARCRDIIFLERVLHKTRIRLRNGECVTTAAPQELLRDNPACFLRCHQSYWVNLDFIQSMRADSFVLTDGTTLPITRTYRNRVREQLFSELNKALNRG